MTGETETTRELGRSLEGVGVAVAALGSAVASAELSVVFQEASDGMTKQVELGLVYLEGLVSRMREVLDLRSAPDTLPAAAEPAAEPAHHEGADIPPMPDITDELVADMIAWARTHNSQTHKLSALQTQALEYMFRNTGRLFSTTELMAVAGYELADNAGNKFVSNLRKRFQDGDRFGGFVISCSGRIPVQSGVIATGFMYDGDTRSVVSTEQVNDTETALQKGKRGSVEGEDALDAATAVSTTSTPVEQTESTHSVAGEDRDDTSAMATDEGGVAPDEVVVDFPSIATSDMDKAIWAAFVANAGVPLAPRALAAQVQGFGNKTVKQAIPKFFSRLRTDPLHGQYCVLEEDGSSQRFAVDLTGLVGTAKPVAPALPPKQEQSAHRVPAEAQTNFGSDADPSPYTHLNETETHIYR